MKIKTLKNPDLMWIAFVLQDKAWQVECIYLLKAIC